MISRSLVFRRGSVLVELDMGIFELFSFIYDCFLEIFA